MKKLSLLFVLMLFVSVVSAAELSPLEVVSNKRSIINNAVSELNKKAPREIDKKLSFMGANAELSSLTLVYMFKVNILGANIRDKNALSGAMTKSNRESICKTIVNKFDINARLDLVDKNDVFLSSSEFNKEICNPRR